MVRGYYSAASGILSKQKAIDTISNNIANTSVAGYKSQSTVESSFGDHLVSRVSGSSKIGQWRFMHRFYTRGAGAYGKERGSRYTGGRFFPCEKRKIW